MTVETIQLVARLYVGLINVAIIWLIVALLISAWRNRQRIKQIDRQMRSGPQRKRR